MKRSGGPWLVVALLVPVALLNDLDRQLLASMKFSVMHDVPDIGREARWGTILAQFKWVYAGVSPFGGFLSDRYGRRPVIVGSLLVWSVVTWLAARVAGYDELLATRALMGVSQALYIPAALALIADVHPGATRSRAVGLHQMGIYLGTIVGGFRGYAAESGVGGWRWAFAACGVAGVLYALPLFLLLGRAARGSAPAPRSRTSLGTAFRELAGNASFVLLVVYFTLPALAGWVVRDWMPAILKAEFGIGQGVAGVSATLYWQAAAIVGAVAGGWLADRWMRRTPRGRIRVSALGMSLIVPAMFGVGYAPATGALWVAVAFLVLFGLGWGCFDPNNMPILAQIVRPQLRATGYGVMNFVSISIADSRISASACCATCACRCSASSASSRPPRCSPSCWCCSSGRATPRPQRLSGHSDGDHRQAAHRSLRRRVHPAPRRRLGARRSRPGDRRPDGARRRRRPVRARTHR